MSLVPDFIVLCVVWALAGLYTLAVFLSLTGARGLNVDAVPPSERLGLSIVLAVLLLAIANNFLSALVGSVVTAVVLLGAPVCHVLFAAWRRGWRALVAPLRPTLGRDAAAAGVSLVFILAIAHKLFFRRTLVANGLLYPDLPWHVGRVAEQAFHSTAGYWPLSPLAFPASLPFVSFLADSLVSATFRYLPISIETFTYTQVLFCWVLVLWIAVVLVAGGGFWRALIVLTIAMFAIPALMFDASRVGLIVFIFFLANPNSAMAWPIGLALGFHLYQSHRRRTPPFALALAVIAPASLFFKANQAFAFGFLQAVGFALWMWTGRARDAFKWAAVAAGVWAAVIFASLAMGTWPPSKGINFSIENFRRYALVAAQGRARNAVRWWGAYAALTAVVCALAASRKSVWRDVVIPIAALVAAMGYLALGWFSVVPNGLAEGEPMHVNIELVMWIITVIVAGAVWRLDARGPAVAIGVRGAALAAAVFMIWMVNTQPQDRGGIPIERNVEATNERRARFALRTSIPDGHCFWYGRRYVIDVGGAFEPDAIIAATGCPVINGQRWRGYLGTNDPDALRAQTIIAVPSGPPFTMVRIR